MIAKLKSKFYNTSFYNKILILCLSLSLIPTFILGFFSQSLMSNSLIIQEKENLYNVLEHEILALESKLNTYIQMMNLIMINDDIEQSLFNEYDDNFQMYLSYRDVIVPMIDNFKFIQPDINYITIYTDNNIYEHSNYIAKFDDLKNKTWYNKDNYSYTPVFYVDESNKVLELVCQNYNHYSDYQYYVVMGIDYNNLFDIYKDLFNQNYGFRIYEYEDSIFNYEILSNDTFASIYEINLNEYVLLNKKVGNTNWNAYLYRPISEIVLASNIVTIPLILVLVSCVIVIYPLSRKFTKALVKPIQKLQENMAIVEESSYFEINVVYNSSDEIGQLYNSFDNMLQKTHYLVNEVLQSKISQQEYEMKALQAQINPHFLYNSLALIHNKAIIEEQPDISKIANQLSQFYRTTLNKGKSITTVKDELDNVKAYINIQLIMHDYSFDVVYDLDEELNDFNMPNLTCQPLIENAIEHGIDHSLSNDKAVLSVSTYLENDLIVIKIMDNGCGMSDEKCCTILTSKSDGYGVQNVHHRIQLIYGETYGLEFQSTLNYGTRVKIAIPKQIPKYDI